MGLNSRYNLRLTGVAGRRRLAADGWDGLGRRRNAAGGVVEWAVGVFAGPMHSCGWANDGVRWPFTMHEPITACRIRSMARRGR